MIKKRTTITVTIGISTDQSTSLTKIIRIGNFMYRKENSKIAIKTTIKITTITIQIEILIVRIIIMWTTIPIKNIKAEGMVKITDIINIEILIQYM